MSPPATKAGGLEPCPTPAPTNASTSPSKTAFDSESVAREPDILGESARDDASRVKAVPSAGSPEPYRSARVAGPSPARPLPSRTPTPIQGSDEGPGSVAAGPEPVAYLANFEAATVTPAHCSTNKPPSSSNRPPIPKETVERVREAASIRKVAERLLGLELDRQGFAACPFHEEDSPSFHVREAEGTFKCFGCGKGGDVFKAVELAEGKSFPEAVRAVAQLVGIEVDGGPAPARTASAVTKKAPKKTARKRTKSPADFARMWAELDREVELTERFALDPELAARYLRAGRRTSRDPFSQRVFGYWVGDTLHGAKFRLPDGALWHDYRPDPAEDEGKRARRLSQKFKSWTGSKAGHLVLGLDLAAPGATLLLVAGEKDWLVAMSHLDRERWAPVTGCAGEGAPPPAALLEAAAGRDVVVFYDGDETGRRGAKRAAAALAQRARSVRIADPGDGLDLADLWLRSGTAGLVAALEDAKPAEGVIESAGDGGQGKTSAKKGGRKKEPAIYRSASFEVGHRGALFRVGHGRKGDVRLDPIANFHCRVVEDVVLDSGEEDPTKHARHYVVEGAIDRGRQLEPFGPLEVDHQDFEAMKWPQQVLGSRARFFSPFRPSRERAVEAALEMSEFAERRIYAHLGWVENWRAKGLSGPAFLHAGGAVTEHGHEELEVRPDEPLKHYRLPPPPSRSELAALAQVALGWVLAAPRRMTFPLLAAAFRAPLGEVNFGLFARGTSGAFKSSVCALAQQFFGPAMDQDHLPASFLGTNVSLEFVADRARDSLMVVDDFKPETPQERAELNKLIGKLVRGAGNRQGRTRALRSGQGLQRTNVVRCLAVYTGEELPTEASVIGRLVVIEFSKGGEEGVHVPSLSRSQAKDAIEARAAFMAGYLAWVAPRLEELRARVGRRSLAIRDELKGRGGHERAPANVAQLVAALEVLADFVRELGLGQIAEDLASDGRAALEEALDAHGQAQAVEAPVPAFLRGVRSAISSGKAHVATLEGERPENPAAWGWRRDDYNNWREQGRRIGRLRSAGEEDELLLDPAPALEVAGCTVKPHAMMAMLLEQGLTRVSPGRNGLRVWIDRLPGSKGTQATLWPVSLEDFQAAS